MVHAMIPVILAGIMRPLLDSDLRYNGDVGQQDEAMRHRHLNHQAFTLAAIGDIISRGRWDDWADLRAAALSDPTVLDRISRVCSANVGDPYAQRYHFWLNYAKEHRPAT